MTKRVVATADAPSPAGPYSQAIVVEGGGRGDFVFVAGTLPLDPATKKIVGTTIEEQSEQALRNAEAILKEAGVTMADVVKTTVHLDDISRISAFNSVYEKFFHGPKPVRTTVGSQMGSGIMIEIDFIAVI
jgi:2-iminobutanoate/2-iminopropanoate deaminase